MRNLGRQEHLVVYQYVGAYLTKRFQQADCVMINGGQKQYIWGQNKNLYQVTGLCKILKPTS